MIVKTVRKTIRKVKASDQLQLREDVERFCRVRLENSPTASFVRYETSTWKPTSSIEDVSLINIQVSGAYLWDSEVAALVAAFQPDDVARTPVFNVSTVPNENLWPEYWIVVLKVGAATRDLFWDWKR